jgi:hypothetical protein
VVERQQLEEALYLAKIEAKRLFGWPWNPLLMCDALWRLLHVSIYHLYHEARNDIVQIVDEEFYNLCRAPSSDP